MVMEVVMVDGDVMAMVMMIQKKKRETTAYMDKDVAQDRDADLMKL